MEKKKGLISRLQDYLETQSGQTMLNYLYSWGAAVVILGALFKLTHIQGADIMLFLGMGTEVFVFIVSGFERQSAADDDAQTPQQMPTTSMGGMQVPPVIYTGSPAQQPVAGVAPATTDGASAPAAASENTLSADEAATAQAVAQAIAAQAAAQGTAPSTASAASVDVETMNAMTRLAAAQAAANATAQSNGGVVPPVIEGKIDVPEMQQVTEDYISQMRELTESLQHIADQSAQMEQNADEIERLSRNLTTINTIYETHLKSLGSQMGNIDVVNEQTKRMAEQIQELNEVYKRMLLSMTVNMKQSNMGHAEDTDSEIKKS